MKVSSLEINGAIPIREVMSTPVITVLQEDSVKHIAKLMEKQNIGSIVVINNLGEPIGLITERDLATRVVANNLLPSEVKAIEVMSSPIRTIHLSADIKDAAKRMQKFGIRRVVVMDKGEMVGILSSRDIIEVTPALIEILMEKARIVRGPQLIKKRSSAGYCDRCRQWSEQLLSVDGEYLCEVCHAALKEE
jgi:CBS domain-containing protein